MIPGAFARWGKWKGAPTAEPCHKHSKPLARMAKIAFGANHRRSWPRLCLLKWAENPTPAKAAASSKISSRILGFEAVLTRKYNPNSARPRIFDGAAEAKLIALTLSPAPEGFARWSLRLLEEKVVELHIVDHASDNTIGRTLKKTFSNRISSSNG